MRINLLAVLFLLFAGVSFGADTVEKVDDTKFKVVSTKTEERVFDLKRVDKQIAFLTQKKTELETEIARLEAIKSEAERLGVIETAISE